MFVDNCIISVSDTMQGDKKKQPIYWGDSEQTVEIVGYERKSLPGESHTWKREQIECLPTVGGAAR